MQESSGELQLSPVTRRRAYQEVVAQIQREILAGRLRSGDRLPGERQLAERLGVSRASVREALRVLEALDLVRSRTGTGPDSGSIIVQQAGGGPSRDLEAGGSLGGVLLMHTALEHFALEEMVEARVALEALSVRRAATETTADHLEVLEDLVVAMEAPGVDPEPFMRLDTDYHLALAGACGNRVVAYVMRSLRSAIDHWMHRMFEHNENWSELRAEVAAEHRSILELVRVGDGDTAAYEVEAHVRKAHERLKA
ncbi:FadR family transcriptional regulator [Egibacter rhizosphaerae]|uniref:FadR family transcriptional regulator n=1 Tax=Egibacter rhizosphaerae TaxID=1670831 RepID=A0A411YBK0_9ACTN|nr:FadR/GntR family transcriptional regulator [Egibacter rhizosphaerae]QBI18555.1 FadR family transcriptional regulator [Egibacter rhizosphaerae]